MSSCVFATAFCIFIHLCVAEFILCGFLTENPFVCQTFWVMVLTLESICDKIILQDCIYRNRDENIFFLDASLRGNIQLNRTDLP